MVRIAERPISLRPDSKRTRPGREPEPRPDPAPAPAGRRRRGARTHDRDGSLPIARENSKYPKGTPFVLNFLYIYTTNFHLMANVGLNAFSYL